MASSNNYQIADTDELEALGRDDDGWRDTSAGLEHNDDVGLAEAAASSSKRRRCVCLVLVLVVVASVAIFFGVYFGQKRERSNGGNETTNEPSSPVKSPVSAPSDDSGSETSTTVPTYTVSVLAKLPHDTKAFLQGLEYADGYFYESTGLRGQSSLRKVEMDTGKISDSYKFDDSSLFGEGITLHKDEHIFMLTWEAGRGFIFNQSTLDVLKEWKYDGEGWGLTMDREADEVYMSDGTSSLRVLDPEDLSEKRRITVTLHGKKVSYLNELEWVCGEVWANVWQTKNIYRINPSSGVVKSVIDASALPEKGDITPSMDVLNGIAFDKESGRLWLSGKLWSKVYQVSISDSSLDLTKCK